MKIHNCPFSLKIIVIPECLCRESSVFAVSQVAGSPAQAFGDDGLNYYPLLLSPLVFMSLINKNTRSGYTKVLGHILFSYLDSSD